MLHIPRAAYPICPLCSGHVELESANTDEKGQAVHEECYVSHLIAQQCDVRSSNDVLAYLLRIPRPEATKKTA